MKRIFFALTAIVCFGTSVAPAQAQYQQPAQRYAQPQAVRAGGYQAARPAYGAQQPAYGVQQVAMRPSTNTYAATPTASFGLKPVNPPSPATQRILMASRNQPTPAPVQGGQPGPAAQARSTAKLPPSPAQANWGAPPYAQYDNGGGAYGSGQFAGGGMGAAPVAAQPDGNFSGNGPIASGGGSCEGGQCGDNSCAPRGCCFLCLPSLGGCCSKCCCGACNACCLRTTGDLVQHTPFFGTTHGYYYFRPYHVMHVFSQQELTTRWGGDPRNPYDNSMFQRTYEAMGVDLATQKAREDAAAKAKAAGIDPNAGVQEYVVPGQSAVPTPLPGGYQGTMNYAPPGQYAPQGQYAPGQYPTPGMPGQGFQGGYQGGIPQGAMPNAPGPSIEYVPNR